MLGCACLACCDYALTHINLNLHALYAIIKQPFHKLYYLTRGENIFIFSGLLATHAHTSAFVTKTSETGKTQNTTYSPEWGIIYFAYASIENVCKFGQLKYLFYCELPSDVILYTVILLSNDKLCLFLLFSFWKTQRPLLKNSNIMLFILLTFMIAITIDHFAMLAIYGTGCYSLFYCRWRWNGSESETVIFFFLKG